MPRTWGSVARRGGRVVAGEEWRDAPEGEERPASRPPSGSGQARPRANRAPTGRPARNRPAARSRTHPGTDVNPAKGGPRREGRDRRLAASGTTERSRTSDRSAQEPRRRSGGSRLPSEVVREVQRVGGRRGNALADRLGQATEAYAKDRYPEARAILRPLARELETVASVRELYGLVLYRMGSWAAALKELLEAYRLSDSVDQHPVIADCYRALGRHTKVEKIWEELRRAGASAEVLAEGRLVRAGALADKDKLPEAIQLLESAVGRDLRKPRLDHLRQWYALGDLYERAGDIPKARAYFTRVAIHDPEHADVEHRLRALR